MEVYVKKKSYWIVAFLVAAAIGGWAGGATEEAAPETREVAMGEYKEAPMLAARVAAGELPPVDERLPEVPVVVQAKEIGKYGGTLTLFHAGGGPWGGEFAPWSIDGGPNFMRRLDDGTYTPELMESIEISDDYQAVTLHLKKGIKWSDGEPVKVEDYTFAYNDLQLHPDVNIWQGFDHAGTTKIDDETFRLDLKRPYLKAMQMLSGINGTFWESMQPFHYLKKWHIDYNEDAQELAKDEGFQDWWEALHNHFWWAPPTDINKPTVARWIITQQDSSLRIFERNPYWIRVDQAGNQLPYLDGGVIQIVDGEVKNLKIISGEPDIAFAGTSFDHSTLYKENAAANNQTVYEIKGPNASEFSFHFMHTSPSEEKNDFFKQPKFRQAMSLALNRDEINQVVFLGKGVPGQATHPDWASWFKEEWRTAYAEYDPARANQLLDEIGLEDKNSAGIRILPGGKPFQIIIEYPAQSTGAAVKTMELSSEYWAAIGIDVLLKAVEQTMFWERGPQQEVLVEGSGGMIPWRVHKWSKQYASWLSNDKAVREGRAKLSDFTDGVLPGVEPPDWVKTYYDNWEEVWYNLPDDSTEYLRTVQENLDFQAENILIVGTVGYVPHLLIAKNTLGNIPTAFPPGSGWWGGFTRDGDTIYFK
jgi:peptide/nickel transport system substrate-binding protein